MKFSDDASPYENVKKEAVDKHEGHEVKRVKEGMLAESETYKVIRTGLYDCQ
jgi:hypothetical protein